MRPSYKAKEREKDNYTGAHVRLMVQLVISSDVSGIMQTSGDQVLGYQRGEFSDALEDSGRRKSDWPDLQKCGGY